MQYGINFFADNPEIITLINENLPKFRVIHNNNQAKFILSGNITEEDLLVFQQEPRCKYPWEHILIDLSGDVRFCCHSRQKLGNLNNNDFMEIWNSDTAQSIRKNFLRNQLPDECLACPLRLSQNQIWDVA